MAAWRDCKLGDLLEIKHGYAFLGEHFANAGSHIVLTPGNFYDEGGFKHKGDKEKWYNGPIPDGYVLNEGDLIVAMTEQAEGLLGSSAMIPRGGLYLHNQRLGLVQIRDATKADRRFLYYAFKSKPVRQQIRASASGAKIRHTAPSRIAEVNVSVPLLPVQKRIAAILSAYDDLIENNTRRIQILERMAQALYREWFVHFRFPDFAKASSGRPGHAKVKRVASPLGPIPQGWSVRRLDEVASVNTATIRRGDEPDDILYVDISSVGTGRIENIEPMAFANAPGRARRIVRHGDTIWSCVRPNRKSFSLILDPPADLIVSTGFAVLTPTTVPFSFLHQAVTTDDFVGYLTNHATGAAYPAVTAKDFEAAQILVPDEPALRQFHEHCELKWTPKLRPAAKLGFSRSARREKEQIDETKTQAV
jgi:type I restriction enzyme S subunit